MGVMNPCIASGVEILVMCYYFFRFLEKEINIFCCFFLCILGSIAAAFCPGSEAARILLVLLLAGAGLFLCHRGFPLTLLYAVATVEMMRLCFGISASLSCLLSPVLFPQDSRTVALLFMAGGSIAALLLAVLCYRAMRKYFACGYENRERPAFAALIPALLIFAVGGYISSCVYGDSITVDRDGYVSGANHLQMLLLQLLGAASIFCLLYACGKLSDYLRLRTDAGQWKREADLQRQYAAEAKIHYENTRAFRHDLKNHLMVIQGLLQNGQNAQALSYTGTLKAEAVRLSFPFHTGNPALDVLLADKAREAAKNGALLSCSLRLPTPRQASLRPVNDVDLCVILSNALDNAICASKKLESGAEKSICISGGRQGDFFFIEVRNHFRNDPSRHPTLAEGTGLRNIRAAARRYHGTVDMKTEGNEFILSVLLVIPQHPDGISHQKD